MSTTKTRKAMIAAVKARLEAVVPAPAVSWPNKVFNAPADTLWCGVHWMPGDRVPITLGIGGEDEFSGFVQVDVNLPQDKGDMASENILQSLEDWFVSGRKLDYDGQVVMIERVSRGPGRLVDPNWRESIDIYFTSRIQRTNPVS